MIDEKDKPEVERLVNSASGSLAFTAPEMFDAKVRIYIETAWERGRAAGLRSARDLLVAACEPECSEDE